MRVSVQIKIWLWLQKNKILHLVVVRFLLTLRLSFSQNYYFRWFYRVNAKPIVNANETHTNLKFFKSVFFLLVVVVAMFQFLLAPISTLEIFNVVSSSIFLAILKISFIWSKSSISFNSMIRMSNSIFFYILLSLRHTHTPIFRAVPFDADVSETHWSPWSS